MSSRGWKVFAAVTIALQFYIPQSSLSAKVFALSDNENIDLLDKSLMDAILSEKNITVQEGALALRSVSRWYYYGPCKGIGVNSSNLSLYLGDVLNASYDPSTPYNSLVLKLVAIYTVASDMMGRGRVQKAMCGFAYKLSGDS